MHNPQHLAAEIDWLLDWLDAQYDADRTEPEIRADPYYQRLVTGMQKLRQEKWGRCADCEQATSTCVTEMLATGQPCTVCPVERE